MNGLVRASVSVGTERAGRAPGSRSSPKFLPALRRRRPRSCGLWQHEGRADEGRQADRGDDQTVVQNVVSASTPVVIRVMIHPSPRRSDRRPDGRATGRASSPPNPAARDPIHCSNRFFVHGWATTRPERPPNPSEVGVPVRALSPAARTIVTAGTHTLARQSHARGSGTTL